MQPGLFNRRWQSFWQSPERPFVVFRWVAIAAQAGAMWICWPVWQVRELPPMLPALPVRQFDIGWPLYASLAIALVLPRLGTWLHVVLLILAMLQDQMRMQPEFISLAILMLGTLPYPSLRSIARVSLIAMWFYAGFHKLLSPGFLGVTSRHIVRDLYGIAGVSDGVATAVGVAIALGEMSLAFLATCKRTRSLAAWVALAVHLGIFVAATRMLRVVQDFENESLWWTEPVLAWNLALAVAGLALIANWRESLFDTFCQGHWLRRCMLATLLVSPLGYYFGVVDAYLSHCLYSGNTLSGWVQRGPGDRQRLGYDRDLSRPVGVPIPPAQRTLESYFRQIRQPGETLVIEDPRWFSRWRGIGVRHLNQHGEFARGYAPGEGYWEFFHPSGRPAKAGNFESGKETGVWKSWDEQGRLESEGSYLGGDQHGTWKFYRDGNLAEQVEFVYGKKHGRWIVWDPAGGRSEGQAKHGEQAGRWTFYSDAGVRQAEGELVDGQMHGLWTFYEPDGTAIVTEYDHGRPQRARSSPNDEP